MDHLIIPYLSIATFTTPTSHFIFSACLILLALAVALAIRRWRKQRLLPTSPVSLPVIGHLHLLGPLIHQSFHRLSLHYGPLFSLKLGSVPCIVVSSPELAREFLKNNELVFSSRKLSIAIKRLTYDSAYAFAPYGPYWKFINKLTMTNLLSPRALARFLPIQYSELHHFLKVLATSYSAGSSVNLTQDLIKLASNVISHIMFGIRHSDVEGQADEARALVREVTQIFGEFNVSDFVWLAKGVDLQGFHGRIEDIHRRYDSLLESIIKKREDLRRAKREEHDLVNGGDASCDNEHQVKDFLDLLLDVMEDDGSEIKITRNNIKALILDFLTAATHTTAISIEWSLAELINNPRALSKAQEELDRIVGRNRLVQDSDLPDLPYIQAVVKETFRLHPPIPMLIRKSTGDCTVNGHPIPEHTLLFVNIWAMGRDPKCWDGPMDFRPERFLGPSDGGQVGLAGLKGQNFKLLPFGSGRRGCPGVNLALQEVPIVLAALIQCFEWVPSGETNGSDVVDMSEQPGLTAPRANDLVCVPTPRFDMSKIIS